jgi:hypothetical protein
MLRRRGSEEGLREPKVPVEEGFGERSSPVGCDVA